MSFGDTVGKNKWVLLFVGIEVAIILAVLFFNVFTNWKNVQDKVGDAYTGSCVSNDYACEVADVAGFPRTWLAADMFIWYGIVPLLGMTFIIFGFLDQIKIFDNTSLNFLIALFGSISTIPIGGYAIFVIVMFQSIGQFAVWLFAILAVSGLFLMGVGKLTSFGSTYAAEAIRGLNETYKGLLDRKVKEIRDQEKIIKDKRNSIKKLTDQSNEYAKRGNEQLVKFTANQLEDKQKELVRELEILERLKLERLAISDQHKEERKDLERASQS